jgi:O-antigen ligase
MLLPTVFVVCSAWGHSTSPSALTFYLPFQFLMNLALMLFFLAIYRSPYGPHGLGGIRTGFAYAAISALPYAIWQMRRRPSLGRVFVVVSAVIVCLTIGSRSTIVLLPIALLGSLVFIRRRRGQTVRAIIQLSLLGVAVGAIAFAIPVVRAGIFAALNRFTPSATRLDVPVDIEAELSAPMSEQTDLERRLSLFVAGRSFLARPLTGGGYYSTLAITRSQFNIPIGAHGLPSVLLGELGIVGTILFSWLIVRFFRGIRAGKRRARSAEEREFFEATTVTMVVVLLFGMFHQVDQTPAFFALLAWAPTARVRAPTQRIADGVPS